MEAGKPGRTLRPSSGRAAALRGCGLRPPLRHSSSSALCSRRQPRREQRGGSAAVAAAPAAVAAAAAGPLLSPALVFDAATVLVLPFYTLMIAAPRRQLTQRLFRTPALFTAAAALYALLLAMWRPLPAVAAVVQGAASAIAAAAGSAGGPAQALRAALPSMPAFAALFGSPEITALAWVHLVLLDLLQARWVYQDGRRNNIPTWHSAVLCFMVGPLGLLCHLVTKAAVLRWRGRGGSEEYVVYRF